MPLTDDIHATLNAAAHALHRALDNCSRAAAVAAQAIAESPGPLITTGMGKSGYIAMKAAATFRSLGKPSFFLHPGEASHGDLGLITDTAMVLAISNSGETPELGDVLMFCQEGEIPVVGLTGKSGSTLSKVAYPVVYGVVSEACPNGLAPTTSTTVAMALCDALAVSVARQRGTTPADFRRYHPGGKLGAALATVEDVMLTGARMPLVHVGARMLDVVVTMTGPTSGVVLVMDGDRLHGIITDGDVRRNQDRLTKVHAVDIATENPVTITPYLRLPAAVEVLNQNRVTAAPVVREGRLVGLVHLHDILRVMGVS